MGEVDNLSKERSTKCDPTEEILSVASPSSGEGSDFAPAVPWGTHGWKAINAQTGAPISSHVDE